MDLLSAEIIHRRTETAIAHWPNAMALSGGLLVFGVDEFFKEGEHSAAFLDHFFA